MTVILKTENIGKEFRLGGETVHALRDVSLEIAPHSLTVLKGRSGSGKTTLLNLLGALDYPTRGRILFDGREITGLSEGKRDTLRRQSMGFVFQSVALISMMTAYENVEFGLRIAGFPMKERKRRAVEALAMVGLEKRMHHRPHALSGGEQQRVAIARAVAHRPKVIFADEPTAELDTHLGLQVVKLFKKLVVSEGMTILMTTHDPGMMEVADRVYALEDGEIADGR